jgi:hypothetical protein
MLHIGTKMFMQILDNSGQKILHPATVIEVEDGIITAEFEEDDFQMEAEQEVFVYHDLQQEFMKQSAVVEVSLEEELTPVVRFRTTSEPVSAENRQCFRVSTVIADLVASLGPEDTCPLLDVSATGFALIAKKKYDIGNHIEVILYFEDKTYSGMGCVQSVQEFSKGRYRYGLLSVDDKQLGGDLQKGLAIISTAVQREQLRRLAGIA